MIYLYVPIEKILSRAIFEYNATSEPFERLFSISLALVWS